MRLLVLGGLGGLGPYPERLQALRARGHTLWYACSHHLPAVQPHLGDIPAIDLSAAGVADLVRRLPDPDAAAAALAARETVTFEALLPRPEAFLLACLAGPGPAVAYDTART